MRIVRIISSLSALVLGMLSAWGQQTSLTVDYCVSMALQNSADVKNARMESRQARLQKQEAVAEYFPSISANVLAFHALNPLIDISITDVLGTSDMAYYLQYQAQQWAAPYGVKTSYRTMQYGYSGNVMLTQPVFAGGRVINGNRLAALGVRAADAKASLQDRQSADDIQKLFYQVLALQQKEESLELTSELLDSLYRDVSAAVSAGFAVSTDLSAVNIKRSELKAGRNKLRLGLRIAKMNLLNNIGVAYNPYPGIVSDGLISIDDFVLEGDLADVAAPDAFYVSEDVVASNMQESTLLRMQVEAKILERKMTVGEALPSLLFGATYGYSKLLNAPRRNGIMFATLSIPITDWGKNARKLERQQLEVEKARNQKDFLEGQIVLKIRQLYMELCSAYDQMQIASEALELSRERLEQLRVSYGAGVCTITELLQCQNEYRNSQQEYIDAHIDYLSALETYRLHTSCKAL